MHNQQISREENSEHARFAASITAAPRELHYSRPQSVTTSLGWKRRTGAKPLQRVGRGGPLTTTGALPAERAIEIIWRRGDLAAAESKDEIYRAVIGQPRESVDRSPGKVINRLRAKRVSGHAVRDRTLALPHRRQSPAARRYPRDFHAHDEQRRRNGVHGIGEEDEAVELNAAP